nr:alpha/beta fold hydrolase [Halobacillus locisalis]
MLSILLLITGCFNQEKEQRIVSKEKYTLKETALSKDVEAERIEYISDGLKVVGYIVKPKEVEGKLPLMIFNRGGNREFEKLGDDLLSVYLPYWAKQGYVVLASQYRGNDGGEGQEEFGGSDVNDVLNLAEVAKELPYVDQDQKVMLGVSRGGMMTYLAIKEDMDLQAAAVMAGATDLITLHENRGKRMKVILQDLVGDVDEDQKEYQKRSAVNWADQIDVPTLIIHGAEDRLVPVEQSRRLDRKLEEYKKDYKYVEYPDAAHSIATHHERSSKEIQNWFQTHLDD